MAELTKKERAGLPDRAFAYVDSQGHRRVPIHDEAHVRNALARFDRVAFEDDAAEERARRRLLNAAKKYRIVPVGFVTGQVRKLRSRSSGVEGLPTGSVTFLETAGVTSRRFAVRHGRGGFPIPTADTDPGSNGFVSRCRPSHRRRSR